MEKDVIQKLIFLKHNKFCLKTTQCNFVTVRLEIPQKLCMYLYIYNRNIFFQKEYLNIHGEATTEIKF